MGGTTSFTMESIRDGNEIITDGEKIASMVSAFFAKWFSRLPEEKDRDKKLADCILSTNKIEWDCLMASTGIPPEAGEKL